MNRSGQFNVFKLSVALIVTLVLSACGGAGTESGSPSGPGAAIPPDATQSSRPSGSSSSSSSGAAYSPNRNGVVFAVNAGGPQKVTGGGITYASDQYFTGGSVYTAAAFVAATVADTIYQTSRVGAFAYSVPVKNGTYDVVLQFNEFQWASAGKRKITVEAEGRPVLENLDIFARVGANAGLYQMVSHIDVTDGNLTLRFSATEGQAIVSGIVVISSDPVGLAPVVIDTTKPQAPANFFAGDVFSTHLMLKWTAATDNVGIAKYRLLRNGYTLTELNSDAYSYSDTAVAPNTSYTYALQAIDISDNLSMPIGLVVNTGNGISADTVAPTAPAELYVSDVLARQLTLHWGAASDNLGVTQYKILRNNVLVGVVNRSVLSFVDTELAPDTTYDYAVTAVDLAGNESAPQSLVGKTYVAGGKVRLQWAEPTQRANGDPLSSGEIAGYSVRYRLASEYVYTTLPTLQAGTTYYDFTNLIGDYEFQLATIDSDGVYSEYTRATLQ